MFTLLFLLEVARSTVSWSDGCLETLLPSYRQDKVNMAATFLTSKRERMNFTSKVT